jgi:acetone carboxylase gamma subunit
VLHNAEMMQATITGSQRYVSSLAQSGGIPGATALISIMRNTNVAELTQNGQPLTPDNLRAANIELPAEKVPMLMVSKGDIVRMETAGGAGIGDPVLRDAVCVEEDVLRGIVSLAQARDDYGVIIDQKTLKADMPATQKRRQEIRSERLKNAIIKKNADARVIKGKVIRPINWYLDVVEDSGKRFIKCNQCGTVICKEKEDWKKFSAVIEGEASESLAKFHIFAFKRPLEPKVMQFEYLCPHCGIRFEIRQLLADMVDKAPIREEPAFWFA